MSTPSPLGCATVLPLHQIARHVNPVPFVAVIFAMISFSLIPSASSCKTSTDSHGLVTDCQNQQLRYINHIPDGTITLDISYNNFPAINFYMFPVSNIDVKYLTMQHCNTKGIETQAFDQFTKLIKLDLSHNYISTIDETAFLSCTRLKQVNLSNNNITELSAQYFSGLSLHFLDLSNNAMTYLQNDVFNQLTLRNLNLSGNSFSLLSSDVLDPLRGSLRSIQIAYNIEPLTLPEDFFRDLEMDVVDLSYCQLTDFQFAQIISAISLDLSGNAVGTGVSFSQFQSLQKLYMNSMDLRNISRSFLRPLRQLSHLYITDNSIYELEQELFVFNMYLEVINLSGNNIESLPPSLGRLVYLRVFNLSHNYINDINNDAFNSMESLQTLDLSFNSIQALPNTFSNTMNRVHNLNISSNPWHCNCQMSWVRASYRTDNRFGITSCETPQQMPLFRLRPVDFQCSKPIITSITENITVPTGESFMVKCNSASDPAPEIRLRNPAGEEMRFQPSPDRSRTITFAMWRISNAEESQSGAYICNATNRLGTIIRTIDIKIMDASLITTRLPLTSSTKATEAEGDIVTTLSYVPTMYSIPTHEQELNNSIYPIGTSTPVFNTERPSFFTGVTLIIVIVASIVVVLVLVIIVCCCCAKRRKTKDEYSPVKSQAFRDLELPDIPPPIHV